MIQTRLDIAEKDHLMEQGDHPGLGQDHQSAREEIGHPQERTKIRNQYTVSARDQNLLKVLLTEWMKLKVKN